jgi:hypothetical protein
MNGVNGRPMFDEPMLEIEVAIMAMAMAKIGLHVRQVLGGTWERTLLERSYHC